MRDVDSPGPTPVLLVEDNPIIREILQAALGEAGCVVTGCASGDEALEALGPDGAPFAALITDVALGPGPNGWEIAKLARHWQPALPVIYVTAMGGREWNSMGAPGSVLLVKPFGAADLLAALNQLLNRGPARFRVW